MPQADKLELSPLPLGTGRSSSAFSAFVDNAAHPALSTKAVPRKHVDVGIDALRSSTCADLSQTNITKLTNTGKVSWLSDPEVEPLLTSLCRPENPLASGPPLSKSPPVSGPPLGKRASKLMVSMTDVTDAALRLPVRMQPPARFLCSLDKKQTPAGDLSDVTTAALGAPLGPDPRKKMGLLCMEDAPRAFPLLDMQEVRRPSVARTKACPAPVRSRRTRASSSAETPATGLGPISDLTDHHSSRASSAHKCCTPRSAKRQLAGWEWRFGAPQPQTVRQFLQTCAMSTRE